MKNLLNETYLARKKAFFGHVSEENWNDWKWQTSNRIKTATELRKYINLTEDEEKTIDKVLGHLRMAITPYYLTLIDPDNPKCPIRQQAIPLGNELFVGKND